jgi:sulfite reductase (ferredoxin)
MPEALNREVDIFETQIELKKSGKIRASIPIGATPREYTIGDMSVGECAREVVPFVEMGLAASERELFEAQVILDDGDAPKAAERAYQAVLQAAKALTRERNANLADDPNEIVREFKLHMCDTRLFHDPYAGGRFVNYLFSVHGDGIQKSDTAQAHQLIEEAQLFVEAAHQCYIRSASTAFLAVQYS